MTKKIYRERSLISSTVWNVKVLMSFVCFIFSSLSLFCFRSLVQIYLSQFGYLPPTARNPASGGLLDENTWNKAIMDFQSFAGVNITGKAQLKSQNTITQFPMDFKFWFFDDRTHKIETHLGWKQK